MNRRLQKCSFQALIMSGLILSILMLSGCVQYPTQQNQNVDLRPGISFTASDGAGAVVLIDGQEMGPVSDFESGKAWLRIVSGTHRVQVVRGSEVLYDESVYLGDGVNKTLRIN